MLKDFKLMLGIAPEDTDCDAKLSLILETASARLKNLLGGIEPPEAMRHIILEAAVSRFNRIGSEGMASHTVEGESLSFQNDDFAGFSEEIQAFLEARQDSARGRVRLL